MAEIWAALKTINTIVKTVKQVITLIGEIYEKKLEAEKQETQQANTQTANDLVNAQSSTVNEYDPTAVRNILRQANGLPTKTKEEEKKPTRIWGRR